MFGRVLAIHSPRSGHENGLMTTTTAPKANFDTSQHRALIAKTIAKKSFCTIATTSPGSRSHSAGVVYVWADGAMWIHASSNSRKARSIASNSHIGICIPFRRMPVGPPYTIHFQGQAELVAVDAPEAVALLERGRLKKIAGHGALDMADGSFIKITPAGNAHSFGLGVKMIEIVKDPLTAGARSVSIAEKAS
jgi:hypothetical protein